MCGVKLISNSCHIYMSHAPYLSIVSSELKMLSSGRVCGAAWNTGGSVSVWQWEVMCSWFTVVGVMHALICGLVLSVVGQYSP